MKWGGTVGQMEWLQMLACQQLLHRFSRAMLHQSEGQTLTASQLELLSLLYLYPEESTPLALSRQSGMKKEAVSRCLRQLSDLGCICREKHPQDERSYVLHLTETGHAMLAENYTAILRPLYELRRQMGDDFEQLFRLIAQAGRLMEQNGAKQTRQEHSEV